MHAFFPISAVIILLGLQSTQIGTFLSGPTSYDLVGITSWALFLAPILPLLLVIQRWRSPYVYGPLFIGLWMSVIAFGGLIITGAALSISGPGFLHTLFRAIALMAGTLGAIHLFRERTIRLTNRSFSGFAMGLSMCISLWSLVSAPVSALHASALAQGRPFCIASHEHKLAVSSWADLRGLSFYTTAASNNLAYHWYFHGLAIVQDQSRQHVYNWSPQSMWFKHFPNPEKLIESPINACTPTRNFASNLPII